MKTEKEFLKEVGAKIRALRLKRGMKQHELGLASMIDPYHITWIECGKKNVKLMTLKHLADTLKVDVKDFL